MAFNILNLFSGRTRSKFLGLAALFGAALCFIVLSSRPSDSQNSAQLGATIDCFEGASARAATVSSLSLDDLALGTNLSGIADWSTQLPFLDAFKSGRPWITQCDSDEPGCSGGWATDEAAQLDLDEFGWVKSLPAPNDPPEYTRVGTLLFREIDGRYPGGQYVVLYQGEGTIEYRYDAEKDESLSAPGRDVINVTPSGRGIWLQITATDPNRTGNYIRDIHVVPIDYEQTFQTDIFNPVFLDKIRKFKVIRFMDWMATNNSEQGEWADRPKVNDAFYSRGKGVPLEIMLALANRLGAHPWFTMPHQSTDEYITNFATQVKTCLDPRLRAYVEFSNEVWNWQFQQAHYALQQGKSRWGEDKGDAHMQWYGMRSAQMSDIWKQVFGDQRDRVATILSTQTAWKGLETSALDCSLWAAEGNRPCYQHGFDAYAITGYFSGRLSDDANKTTIASWMNEADGGFSKAFTQLKQGSVLDDNNTDDTLLGLSDLFQYHQQVSQGKGLRLVAYEGGQHLVQAGDEKITEFFVNLNRQPEMYDIYTQLLNRWKDAGGTLFMHFSDIARPGRWGSWGALEYLEQPGSPKYDALIDFIDQNS
jgi:hypothetical protein